MMHVISGKYRRRKIQSFDQKGIRPTTGMAREAIFNILSHGQFSDDERTIFDGCTVLDLFCGTGALGIEALSRGAERAIFIDKDPKHLDVARHNVEHVGAMQDAQFIRSDSSNPPPAKMSCGLVFLDPPYESGLLVSTLQNLIKGGWLDTGSILVLEMQRNEKFHVPEGFNTLVDRHYGKTRIMLLSWGGAAAL